MTDVDWASPMCAPSPDSFQSFPKIGNPWHQTPTLENNHAGVTSIGHGDAHQMTQAVCSDSTRRTLR